MDDQLNPTGLCGIEFVEYSSDKPEVLEKIFTDFGFSRLLRHKKKAIDVYVQNDMHFLLNVEPHSVAKRFAVAHGPSIAAMGWRVKDAQVACRAAAARGAKVIEQVDYEDGRGRPLPAVEGVGGSIIYFIDNCGAPATYERLGFVPHPQPRVVVDKGFLAIDHLTNNVHQGEMEKWSRFYREVFGFTEVRYFDIRGVKTGLRSYALRSPCGSFCIPINEGTEKQSQINEYLEEYKGAGIQHLAFATRDIVKSLESLRGSAIQTLDIDDQYYREVFQRVPNVTEDHKILQDLQILVDGDEDGYLLQIFTKNLIGPIFIEIIQRKNHQSFGEGNFGALFRSIERDQERRGYLKNSTP